MRRKEREEKRSKERGREERQREGSGEERREEEGCRAQNALVHSFFTGVCCVSDTGEQMICLTHAPSPGVPSLAGRGQQGN